MKKIIILNNHTNIELNEMRHPQATSKRKKVIKVKHLRTLASQNCFTMNDMQIKINMEFK